MLLALLLAIAGAVALTAAVLGMLWLVQFVLGNEERGSRGS